MRITQQTMVWNQLDRLGRRLERMENAQSQLGSGKVVQRPSDDPAAASRALRLRAALRAREQEARNAADAQAWLDAGDSQLNAAVTRLQRGRELLVRAGSSRPQTEREAIAVEIATIREELVGIANSRSAGRAIFAGFADGPAVAKVAGTWTYAGDAGQVTRRVSEQETVTVNVTAADAFGFAAGADVFSLLDRVEQQLLTDDRAGLQTSLGELDDALQRVHGQQSVVGAAANQVESATRRNGDEQLSIRGQLAVTEDVELASAVMELQVQETAYQATLAALGRVLQPSLVDFLR